MSADVTLTVEQFRVDFPEFVAGTYSESVVQAAIDRTECFISRTNSTYLADDCRLTAIEYVTAHLLSVCNAASSSTGGQGGLVGSSSIGSVSVTMIPPPASTASKYWLNQSCYGQAYLALLQSKSPAGLFLGGSIQRVFR